MKRNCTSVECEWNGRGCRVWNAAPIIRIRMKIYRKKGIIFDWEIPERKTDAALLCSANFERVIPRVIYEAIFKFTTKTQRIRHDYVTIRKNSWNSNTRRLSLVFGRMWMDSTAWHHWSQKRKRTGASPTESSLFRLSKQRSQLEKLVEARNASGRSVRYFPVRRAKNRRQTQQGRPHKNWVQCS